jgi:hypothetical protein
LPVTAPKGVGDVGVRRRKVGSGRLNNGAGRTSFSTFWEKADELYKPWLKVDIITIDNEVDLAVMLGEE